MSDKSLSFTKRISSWTRDEHENLHSWRWKWRKWRDRLFNAVDKWLLTLLISKSRRSLARRRAGNEAIHQDNYIRFVRPISLDDQQPISTISTEKSAVFSLKSISKWSEIDEKSTTWINFELKIIQKAGFPSIISPIFDSNRWKVVTKTPIRVDFLLLRHGERCKKCSTICIECHQYSLPMMNRFESDLSSNFVPWDSLQSNSEQVIIQWFLLLINTAFSSTHSSNGNQRSRSQKTLPEEHFYRIQFDKDRGKTKRRRKRRSQGISSRLISILLKEKKNELSRMRTATKSSDVIQNDRQTWTIQPIIFSHRILSKDKFVVEKMNNMTLIVNSIVVKQMRRINSDMPFPLVHFVRSLLAKASPTLPKRRLRTSSADVRSFQRSCLWCSSHPSSTFTIHPWTLVAKQADCDLLRRLRSRTSLLWSSSPHPSSVTSSVQCSFRALLGKIPG